MMGKTTTPDEQAAIAARRQLQIVKLLEAYLKKGAEVGSLCDERDALLKRARRSGLRLNHPVVLTNGDRYELRKTKGKYVHFAGVELKKVAKNPRAVASAVSADGFANTAEAAS